MPVRDGGSVFNLNGPKEYAAYPYSGHGLPGENYAVRMAWVRKQMGMK